MDSSTPSALVLFAGCVSTSLPPYRLPLDVVPELYTLSILTDLEKCVFDGKVDIQITCKKETDTVKIHSKELTIAEKEIIVKPVSGDKAICVGGVEYDKENDFLIIKLNEKLVLGCKYQLHIAFHGNLTNGLVGYYLSDYKDDTNTDRYLAVTQFEPNDAKRAFPCFDEPALKAKYRITLGHKKGLKAISNMPECKTYTKDGWEWSEFQESVPMSTYLVSFCVSDFEFATSKPESNKVIFKSWARKNAIKQVEFAKTYGPKFLNFYESYFDIEFPLPKVDLIALPDFAEGAMENWGLITFREESLLIDPKVTTSSMTCCIAETVAHELSHQWFGNLVTFKWWTDLWLNEGFATYFSTVAIQKQFPEWNWQNLCIASNLLDVLLVDSKTSSHPVSVPIGNPNEIEELFDSISYNKGSMLLHMITSTLGAEVVQAGLKTYLKKFSYKNAEQDDLYACLTEEVQKVKLLPSGVNVKHVMDTWTLQTGFPLLTVKRDGGKLTITQKRYLNPKPKSDDDEKGKWWVPVTYSTAKCPEFEKTQCKHWMSCDCEDYSVDTGAGDDDWIIVNNKLSAVVRINYDKHNWELLAKALHSSDYAKIHEMNRLQLVSDALALAYTGYLDYSLAFDVVRYIRNEKSYLPWIAAADGLEDLELLLWRTDIFPQFAKFIKHLYSEIYKKFSDLKTEPEKIEETRHKSTTIYWSCQYGVGDCKAQAAKIYKEWMQCEEKNPIPKNLRNVLSCEGIKQGGKTEWEFLWKKYQKSNIANEKSGYLYALGCTEDESLLQKYLEWSITPKSGIRRQDTQYVFDYVAQASQKGFELAKTFLEKNIKKIHDFLAPNTEDLGYYFEVLSCRIVKRDEFKKMKDLIDCNKELLKKSTLAVKNSIATVEANLAWMDTFYETIGSVLKVDDDC